MKMTPGKLRWLRVAVFFACLIPFVRLFVLGYTDQLTANPIEFVTRSTGTWTLVFLCIVLSVTPLRYWTGWGWLLQLRRMLGLYAFFYGVLHLTTYVWFDQWFEWGAMIKDIIKRPYITAGFAGFVLMVPLALTSNNWSMRKLGRRWGLLHRLVYFSALLGVLHYWWHKSGKNDYFEPGVYALIIVVLLGYRSWRKWRSNAQRPAVRGSAAPN